MNPELPVIAFSDPMEEEEKKKVEKVNKVEKVTKVTKVTLSTLTTKLPYLIIKNPNSESAGRFKYLAKLLNLKHHELLDLLLAAFAENNPEIEDQLTNQTVRFKVQPVKEEAFTVRNPNVDKILKQMRKLKEENRFDNAEARIGLLFEFLKDKTIPSEQKAEIREFLEGLNV